MMFAIGNGRQGYLTAAFLTRRHAFFLRGVRSTRAREGEYNWPCWRHVMSMEDFRGCAVMDDALELGPHRVLPLWSTAVTAPRKGVVIYSFYLFIWNIWLMCHQSPYPSTWSFLMRLRLSYAIIGSYVSPWGLYGHLQCNANCEVRWLSLGRRFIRPTSDFATNFFHRTNLRNSETFFQSDKRWSSNE